MDVQTEALGCWHQTCTPRHERSNYYQEFQLWYDCSDYYRKFKSRILDICTHRHEVNTFTLCQQITMKLIPQIRQIPHRRSSVGKTPRKCFLQRASNVMFSKFRSWRWKKKFATFRSPCLRQKILSVHTRTHGCEHAMLYWWFPLEIARAIFLVAQLPPTPLKRYFSTEEFTRPLSMVLSQRQATRSDVSFQTK